MDRLSEAELLSKALEQRDTKNLCSCLKFLREGVKEFPNFKDSHGYRVFSKEILRTYLLLGEYVKALESVNEFDLNLDEHGILFARAYQSLGNVDAARVWWLRIASSNPHHGECKNFF